MADVGSYAGEAIEHIKTVQSFSSERFEKTAFAVEVEKAFEVGRQRVKQRAILISGVIVIVFSAIAGMLWVGGSDVIKGDMSAGELGAFVFYAIMVASSMATISEVLGELQRAAGATERLVEILQVESDISAPNNHKAIEVSMPAEVVFKGVDFNYPSRPNQPAIKGLDLTAKQGKVLALVGPSARAKLPCLNYCNAFTTLSRGRYCLQEKTFASSILKTFAAKWR